MATIEYRKGDATSPQGAGVKFICHVNNNRGGWGAGFVVALSKKWSEPEAEYRAWSLGKRNHPFKLGQVQFVTVEEDLCVANMVAQEGYSKPGQPAIRYEALRACLEQVAEEAIKYDASVHAPRFGAGLAGGVWSKIEEIINDTLCAKGVSVFIYDLER